MSEIGAVHLVSGHSVDKHVMVDAVPNVVMQVRCARHNLTTRVDSGLRSSPCTLPLRCMQQV